MVVHFVNGLVSRVTNPVHAASQANGWHPQEACTGWHLRPVLRLYLRSRALAPHVDGGADEQPQIRHVGAWGCCKQCCLRRCLDLSSQRLLGGAKVRRARIVLLVRCINRGLTLPLLPACLYYRKVSASTRSNQDEYQPDLLLGNCTWIEDVPVGKFPIAREGHAAVVVAHPKVSSMSSQSKSAQTPSDVMVKVDKSTVRTCSWSVNGMDCAK